MPPSETHIPQSARPYAAPLFLAHAPAATPAAPAIIPQRCVANGGNLKKTPRPMSLHSNYLHIRFLAVLSCEMRECVVYLLLFEMLKVMRE